jgi:hypothetical protein
VQIDGHLANVVNGVVNLSGAPGSARVVRVAANGKQTTQTVVISLTGPVPTAVELAAPVVTHAPAASVEAPGINRNFTAPR